MILEALSRIRLLFAWYDLWIGVYWDRNERKLYILPLPMLGVVLDLESYYKVLTFNPDPDIAAWMTVGVCSRGDWVGNRYHFDDLSTYAVISKRSYQAYRSVHGGSMDA